MTMFAILVEFVLTPDCDAAFERLVVQNAATSLREEPGCRVFDVCRPAQRLCTIVLYEIYDSAAAFEAHLRSPHYQAFERDTRPMVAAKTVTPLTALSLSSTGA